MSLNKKQVHQLNMMNEAARRSALGDKLKELLDGGGGSGESGLPPGGSDGQILKKVGDEDYTSTWDDSTSLKGVLPTGGTSGQILTKQSDEDYNATWMNAQIPMTPNIRQVVLSGNDLEGATIASTYNTYAGQTQSMQLNGERFKISLETPGANTQTNDITIIPTNIGINRKMTQSDGYESTTLLSIGGGTNNDNVIRYTSEGYRESPERYDSSSVNISSRGFGAAYEVFSDDYQTSSNVGLNSISLGMSQQDAYTNFSFNIGLSGISFKNGLTNPVTFTITADKGLQGSQQMYNSMADTMGTEIHLRGKDAALDSTGNEYVAILPQATPLPDISQFENGKVAVVTFTEANNGDVKLSFRRISETTALPIKNRQITALNAGDIVANMTYTLYLYKPNADNLTDAAWIIQL